MTRRGDDGVGDEKLPDSTEDAGQTADSGPQEGDMASSSAQNSGLRGATSTGTPLEPSVLVSEYPYAQAVVDNSAETPLSSRVRDIVMEDLHWPFRGTPYLPVRSRLGAGKHSPEQVEVDPFPCYGHERRLVLEMAAQVEAAFPTGFLPTYYLLPVEDVGRTNGNAARHWVYGDGEDPMPYEPYIILAGKRIPLHPAMTRYLVAHEYGHVVQWWIERLRNLERDAVTTFTREYSMLRGASAAHLGNYGALRWHSAVGELIANDFRICVCGVETEYWPHPGFEHPGKLTHIQEFWEKMRTWYGTPDPQPLCPPERRTR